MTDPLWRKAFIDLSYQVLGWGLGLGALLAITVGVYPSIADNYAEMVGTLPEEMLAFFGAETGLETFEGYLNAEFFSFAPLILAVFAILAGTNALVGEETRGTLEVLLAWPVSRRRLVAVKLSAMVAGTGAIVATMLLSFSLVVAFLDVEVNWTRILAAFGLLWPFEVGVAVLAMLLSLLLHSRLLAGTLLGVILVASFILESLAGLVAWLDAVRPIYLTTYHQGDNALVAEVGWSYITGLLGLILLAALLVFVVFERRDIGVRSSVLAKMLSRRPRNVREQPLTTAERFSSSP